MILLSLLVLRIDIECASIGSVLTDILEVAEWKNVIVLCDISSSDILSDISSHILCCDDLEFRQPAVQLDLDFRNTSLIIEMFEQLSERQQMNWLVFCEEECGSFLNVVNNYEKKHQMEAYFTYKYQWIVISSQPENVMNSIGNIAHLLFIQILDNGRQYSVSTAMFGPVSTRYLQHVNFHRDTARLSSRDLFPHL